jgi:flavin-dependent dehydrogenase
MSVQQHEVVVIGGGPGGSILAAYLAKAGVDVAIVEKEPYPRFHIGESLLPFSMDIFKEVGIFDSLNGGKYIQKFGAQFVHHEEEGEVYFDFATGLDANHPMAFEVPRSEFDKDLLEHAVSLGAALYQPEKVTNVEIIAEGAMIHTDKKVLQAKFVADATGRDALFGKAKQMRFPNLDLNNVGVFTHFTGIQRFPGKRAGDITIAMLKDQRWCWVIPFQGDRASVGVVCPSKELRQTEDLENYLIESLRTCPALADRLQESKRVAEIGMVSNYSHYCESMVEDRLILVGDAASFLDPIFSSGVHLAISMGREASIHLCDALAKNETLTTANRKENYENFVRTGTRRFHSFIRMFYDTNFVRDMKKTYGLKNLRMAFTSVVAGDVWNEKNPLFRTGVIG